MTTGDKIKYFRKDFLQMTQKDFAEKFDIIQQKLSLIEKGKMRVPLVLLKKIIELAKKNNFNQPQEWWIN